MRGVVFAARAVLAGAVLATRVAAAPATPFVFEPPATLGPAAVSHAAIGATYAWFARDRRQPLRLTITVMPTREVEDRLGTLDAAACVAPFVAELRNRNDGLFLSAQNRPLQVAGHELVQFRWTGRRDGRALTGIVSCGRIGRRYYVVDFVDALNASTRSFPAIRARLSNLVATPP